MFCPECGIEERSANQFCRGCGTDLRRVRFAVEPADKVNASAVLAREEIGRAFAAKIREIQDAGDLRRVADRVLPEIEKFLESPEERRLRRIRTGLLVSAIGLGAAIGLAAVAAISHKEEKSIPRRAGNDRVLSRPWVPSEWDLFHVAKQGFL